MTPKNNLAEIFGEEFAASRKIKGAVDRIDGYETALLWQGFNKMTPEKHVSWLRHFIMIEWHLSRLLAGWIPATPHLQWRLEIPYFLFEDMQHAREMHARLKEFSKLELRLSEACALRSFFEKIAPAPDHVSFYSNIFARVKPALIAAYRHYLERCDEIIDGPTVYSLRRIIQEKERQLESARAILAISSDHSHSDQSETYDVHVLACLEAAGSLKPDFHGPEEWPECPITNAAGPAPERELHDPSLRRTMRFPETIGECPVHGTLKEIIYHNATEWQVIGPMCYAYHEFTEMPLEFFIDFSRHIWDECRHAKMGFRRLKELGYSQEDFIWPSLDGKPASLEEYVAMLTLVGEACSFKRKRGSIVPFLRQGDQKSAILPTIDCVDEQLHVGYGNRWVPEIFRRYRNDTRAFAEIATETRERVLRERDMLLNNEDQRRHLSKNLPLFCSALEFADLDFSKY